MKDDSSQKKKNKKKLKEIKWKSLGKSWVYNESWMKEKTEEVERGVSHNLWSKGGSGKIQVQRWTPTCVVEGIKEQEPL